MLLHSLLNRMMLTAMISYWTQRMVMKTGSAILTPEQCLQPVKSWELSEGIPNTKRCTLIDFLLTGETIILVSTFICYKNLMSHCNQGSMKKHITFQHAWPHCIPDVMANSEVELWSSPPSLLQITCGRDLEWSRQEMTLQEHYGNPGSCENKLQKTTLDF